MQQNNNQKQDLRDQIEWLRQVLSNFFRQGGDFEIGGLNVKPLSQMITNQLGQQLLVERTRPEDGGEAGLRFHGHGFEVDAEDFRNLVNSLAVIGISGSFTTQGEDEIAASVRNEILGTQGRPKEELDSAMTDFNKFEELKGKLDTLDMVEKMMEKFDFPSLASVFPSPEQVDKNIREFWEIADGLPPLNLTVPVNEPNDSDAPVKFDEDPNYLGQSENHSPEPVVELSTAELVKPYSFGYLYARSYGSGNLKDSFTDDYLRTLIEWMQTEEFKNIRVNVDPGSLRMSDENVFPVYNSTPAHALLVWIWNNTGCDYVDAIRSFTNAENAREE